MNDLMIFPSFISYLINKYGLTTDRLASHLRVKESTVLKLKNAQATPSLVQIFKLVDMFPENSSEILFSGLHWYQIRKRLGGYRNFDLNQSIGNIVHGSDIQALSDKTLTRLFEAWNNVKNTSSAETDLIIPPQPSIIILDKCSAIIRDLLKDGEHLYRLHWKEFEDLIAHLLKNFGWSITPMGYTKDDNVDIVAIRSVEPDVNFRMMVQCKKFAKYRKVGVDVVREVWSTKWEKGFHSAMIVTSSFFTKGAEKKAEQFNLELKDKYSIMNWCQKFGKVISF